jgi:hypothetical protein
MTRLFPTVLILMPVAFVLTACGSKPTPQSTAIREASDQPIVAQQPDNSRQGGKPIPPLQLAVPSAMPAQLDGKDLKIMEEDELLGRANQAMRKEDYSRAATFQYWYVQKSKTGQYNLACFLAQVGQADAAFYWLQLAAIEEGVDTQHAERDEDLTLLRSDPRWGKVRLYLAACNRYFEMTPNARTVLVSPQGYKKQRPGEKLNRRKWWGIQ